MILTLQIKVKMVLTVRAIVKDHNVDLGHSSSDMLASAEFYFPPPRESFQSKKFEDGDGVTDVVETFPL